MCYVLVSVPMVCVICVHVLTLCVLCVPGSPGDVTDRFRVRFLGSVQVPYHKGNDVLCAAMQKVDTQPLLQCWGNPTHHLCYQISRTIRCL